ncbi:MAG: HIT domain-containing protein [Actinobacteria bacterium]|nr:HIT domain-containing protein [Actinomycetota bacterium]
MEIIYTPWRYKYVSSFHDRDECVFCKKLDENKDRENLILHRGENCFMILNLFPYSTGHTMVAPYDHIGTIEKLDEKTLAEMMTLSQKCMGAIRDGFTPDGFNLGINIERVAGAGITGHVHLHIVPRWAGDTNFMPICADTKILPMSLDDVWSRMKSHL